MATRPKSGKRRMTQSDVINHFAERTGMKRAQVKQLFEEIANLAISEVKGKGEFVLPGFGKLVRSERKAREGRNPATGETIQISAKTTLKFRIGKGLKDAVLGERIILVRPPGSLSGTKRFSEQTLEGSKPSWLIDPKQSVPK